MNQVQVRIADEHDLDALMELRKEFMEVEFHASEKQDLEEYYKVTKRYFLSSFAKGEQSSCLAYVDGHLAGCSMLCYQHFLPTLDHPTGSRAHLMNVFVKKEFRRLHVGTSMLDVLIEESKKFGVTEISLDATEDGRKLYESYGFSKNEEAMVLYCGHQE